MQKILLYPLSVFVALLIGSSVSLASNKVDKKFYLRADVGYSMPDKKFFNEAPYAQTKKFKASAYGDIGWGYVFNNNFRIDNTFIYYGSYKLSDICNDTGATGKQKANSIAAFFNAYLLFNHLHGIYAKNFNPYLTVGIGLSANKAGDLVVSDGSKFYGSYNRSLAWQIGVGMMYKLSTTLSFDLSYKYTDLGKLSLSTTKQLSTGSFKTAPVAAAGKIKLNNISLGIIWSIL